MPAYRFLLCDLLTDRRLAQLPLDGVTFDRRISRSGALQGTLSATTPQLVATARMLRAYCGRSALWVYRDREIWWGGIPWAAPVGQGQRDVPTLQLAAQTFDSYAARRMLYVDREYDTTDAGVIIPDLWRTIQADPGGNIGVQALDQPIGTPLDRAYYADDGAYVDSLIQEVGDLLDGPEHTIDTYVDDTGARMKRLRLATTLGIGEARTVFQRGGTAGGRVLQWTDAVDATTAGTSFRLRGNGFLSDRVYADDLLADGWPLIDVTDDRTDIDDDDQLAAQTQVLRAQRAGSVRTRGYTVQVGNTGWSPNRLGDPVRLKLADSWHDQTDGDLVVRPVGVKVTAPTRGAGETVELLFGDE